MGTKDNATKAYMSNNTVFADAFNFYLYQGEQVIKPEDLVELDTTESVTIYEQNKNAAGSSEQRYRDVLKSAVIKQKDKTVYAILGIENQSDIHYAMPVRNLIYDGLQYGKQVNTAAARHKEKKDMLSSAEFLSGFSKKDKLTPVITLVVYFGSERWDGAKSLHEMMDADDAKLLRYVQDYHINLIEPADLDSAELDKLTSSLREVLGYIKYSNNKQELLAFVNDNMMMDIEAARVINAVTNTHIDIPADAKEINMCKAIEDLINDSKEEGRLEGLAIGGKEKRANIVAFLMRIPNIELAEEIFGVSADEVMKLASDNGIIIG